MRYIALYILFSLNFSFLNAQGSAFVTIQVELDEPLPDRQGLYIRGNQVLLGNWEHARVLLSKRSPLNWVGIFILDKNKEVSFLLDGGSKRKYFENLDTLSFPLAKDTTIQISLKASDFVILPEPQKGVFHRLPSTMPSGLRNRMVTLRTPIGYGNDTSLQYPLLILHDGQSLFDTKGSPDKGEWHLDETLDSLENNGLIEPFILVTIDHVFQTRSAEYADTEFGSRYRDYIVNHLLPSLFNQFRISKKASDHYIGGAIAGGFVSLLTCWENSEMINNGILLSPAAIIHDNDFRTALKDTVNIPANLKIYMDVGEFGLDEELKPGIDSLHQFLKSKNIEVGYNFVPNSIPDSENMAKRIIPALLHFFKIED